ncbi:hypothetical protein [uncultured Oscillibacter sp.]|uniref:hypothetical protein n=1 Tax=uncultured Oscillibacter sp. TaxID=876091 RepID=UPI00266FBCD3|nr:hypothetical protein [uncultured Oscillibacter sp.]
MENKIARFLCDNSLMQEIYTIKKGPTIVGAWGKDAGTMERRLKLAFVYPNGEVSPIKEYSQSKLSNAKALNNLADLDGVKPELIISIYSAVREKMETLAVQTDSDGKCSLCETYRTLCEYVEQYEEPGRVFVRDGYGNILASYLQTVLDKLELGYTRLELQKNFKAWGLLRTNQGTGHVYSYKINTGSANDWYFSFKMQEGSEAA